MTMSVQSTWGRLFEKRIVRTKKNWKIPKGNHKP